MRAPKVQERMAELRAALAAELLAPPEDLDDDPVVRPTPDVMDAAEAAFKVIEDWLTADLHVYLTPEGGLQAEWEDTARQLSLRFCVLSPTEAEASVVWRTQSAAPPTPDGAGEGLQVVEIAGAIDVVRALVREGFTLAVRTAAARRVLETLGVDPSGKDLLGSLRGKALSRMEQGVVVHFVMQIIDGAREDPARLRAAVEDFREASAAPSLDQYTAGYLLALADFMQGYADRLAQ